MARTVRGRILHRLLRALHAPETGGHPGLSNHPAGPARVAGPPYRVRDELLSADPHGILVQRTAIALLLSGGRLSADVYGARGRDVPADLADPDAGHECGRGRVLPVCRHAHRSDRAP